MSSSIKPAIKVQVAISNDLYLKLKQSAITGNSNDSLAQKIRILIKDYS